MMISWACSCHIRKLALATIALSAGLGQSAGSASSQEASTPWNVQGDLLGGQKKNGEFKDSEDVSGMACNRGDYPMVCVIADDESQGAQIVILDNGEMRAGDFIPLIRNSFNNVPLELDAEGVAYADGAFYVIGSHGRPRHEEGKPEDKNIAIAEATRQVFRIVIPPEAVDLGTGMIKTAPEISGSSALSELIQVQAKLAEWYNKALEDNGLSVEGIAVKEGNLYIGLRGPVFEGSRAVILEVPLLAIFEGQKGEVFLHELDLGKDTQGNPRGVRDLVPHMDGFLVLAGPVNDPKDDAYVIQEGDYTVFTWRGSNSNLDRSFHLKGYGTKVKPEVILPLEKSGHFRALVLFDGPDNGRPTQIVVELK